MNERQSLTFGLTGQEVEFYPPQWWEGVPSSVTYRVFRAHDGNDDTPILPLAAATVDALNATVNATSGKGQPRRNRLFLNSTGDVKVGRPFLLENITDQSRELCVAKGIAATYADLRQDLKGTYLTNSTAKALRCYFVIDATFIQDEANISYLETGVSTYQGHMGGLAYGGNGYRAEFRFTQGGRSYRDWAFFDVVREVVRSTVNIHDLAGYVPDIDDHEFRQHRGLGFRPQIIRAWRMMRMDIQNRHYNIDQFRDPDLHEIHLLACMTVIFESFAFGRAAFAAEAGNWRRRYELLLEQTIQRLKVDQGKEGAVASEPVRQLFFRR